jgi:tRNA threonylcarbamoyladenosine biosynthesis protein TsaB
MVDARRMEVYTQLFNGRGEAQGEVEAKIIDEQSFAEEIAAAEEFVIFGNGAAKCAGTLSERVKLIDIAPSARGLARLAQEALDAGRTEDIAYFEPFYLKNFVVTTSKKKLF